ncbi:hypothetical protein ACI77M_29035 [Pseudomonas fildesensis]|uniref:hypothetical protein n=1 Tax=Pseudomonas fildesensis TaxID=1674920 RepID=UPI00387B627E
MAFRADEAARLGFEKMESYLIPRARDADESQRARSKEALLDMADELGPVVESYPSWHPLVCNHDDRSPATTPGNQCGYKGLDHTRFFLNGFITCPYGDGQNVLDSVENLPYHPIAEITAKRLDVQLYNTNAQPILVQCNWKKPLSMDGTIPASIAVALMLEKEVPMWRWAEVAETWESMRYYLLGSPHGSRSSLFVNQETGQTMKKIWNALIFTGMYGPIKVG